MIAQIREAIQTSGLSLAELGQRAGIDHSRLSRFVRGERTLTLPSVAKVCEELGLELVQVRKPTPAEPASEEVPAVEPSSSTATGESGEEQQPSGEKPRKAPSKKPKGK